jgi:hypothetical protein
MGARSGLDAGGEVLGRAWLAVGYAPKPLEEVGIGL